MTFESPQGRVFTGERHSFHLQSKGREMPGTDLGTQREQLIYRTRTDRNTGILHRHEAGEPCGDQCERYINGERVN